jgi:hypothetical protein
MPSSRSKINRIEQYIKNHLHKSHIKIWADKQKYEISNNPHFPLTSLETDWLAQELSNWLNLSIIEK